jgi:hypothetical protein
MRRLLPLAALFAATAQAQTIRYEAQTRAGVPLVPSIISLSQSGCDQALQARRVNGEWHCHRVTITSNGPAPAPTPAPAPAPSGYDLSAALSTVPFAVTLPSAPVATRSITVSDEAGLRTALATAGADITVQPRAACYSGMFSTGNDQRIRLLAGSVICSPANSQWGGALTVNSQRVHISGPGRILGTFYLNGQDVRLEGLDITTKTDGADPNYDQIHIAGTRTLLSGVSITSRTYCAYSQSATDLTIANSSLVSLGGVQSCLRIVSGERVTVIDSRLRNPTHHTFRVHSGAGRPSDLVYFARNQVEIGGFMANNSAGTPDPQSLRSWWVDNRLYGGQTFALVPGAPANMTLTISGNQNLSGTPPAWTHK